MNDIQPLTNLQCGQTARVGKLTIQGSMRRRLQDIGLIEGTKVECGRFGVLQITFPGCRIMRPGNFAS